MNAADAVAAVRLYTFSEKPLRPSRFVELVNSRETSITAARAETLKAPFAEHLLMARHVQPRTWLQKKLSRRG